MSFTFKFTTQEKDKKSVSYEYDPSTQTITRTEPDMAGPQVSQHTINNNLPMLWRANLGGPDGPEGSLVWLKVNDIPYLCFFTDESFLYFNGQTVETYGRGSNSGVEVEFKTRFPNEGKPEGFSDSQRRGIIQAVQGSSEQDRLLTSEQLEAEAEKQDAAEQLRKAREHQYMSGVAQRLSEQNVTPSLTTMEQRLVEINGLFSEMKRISSSLDGASDVDKNTPINKFEAFIIRYQEIEQEVRRIEAELDPGMFRLANDNPLKQRYDIIKQGFSSIRTNNNLDTLSTEIRAKTPLSRLEYNLERLKLQIKQLDMLLTEGQRATSLRLKEEVKIKQLQLTAQAVQAREDLLNEKRRIDASLPPASPLRQQLEQRLGRFDQSLGVTSSRLDEIGNSLQEEREARAPASRPGTYLAAKYDAPASDRLQTTIDFNFTYAADINGRSHLRVTENGAVKALREEMFPNANYVKAWELSIGGPPPNGDVRNHFILWDKNGPKGELIRFIPDPGGDAARHRYEIFNATGAWQPVADNQKQYYVALCKIDCPKPAIALGPLVYSSIAQESDEVFNSSQRLVTRAPQGSDNLVDEINSLWRSFNALPLGKASIERAHAMHTTTLPQLQDRVRASLTANMANLANLQSVVDQIGKTTVNDDAFRSRLDPIDAANPGPEPNTLQSRAEELIARRDECLERIAILNDRIAKDRENLQSLNLMQIEMAARVRANPDVANVSMVVRGGEIGQQQQSNPGYYNLTSGEYRFKVVPIAHVENEIAQLGHPMPAGPAAPSIAASPEQLKQVTDQQAVIHMPGNGTAFVETSSSIKLTNAAPTITKAQLDATAIDMAKKFIAKSNVTPYISGTDEKYIPQLELMWKHIYARTGKEPLLSDGCALKIDSSKRTSLIKEATQIRKELISSRELQESAISVGGTAASIDEAYRPPTRPIR